jgi:YhcH/YjgK/YiaL family protein
MTLIIDQLSNAKFYEGLHPRLKKGLQFLQENDLNSLEVGKYDIEGDKVFVLIQEYETKPIEQGRYESHYQYTDIQCMVQGEERMGYTNVENVTVNEEDKEKDIQFYEGNGDLLLVKAGNFAIFTPQDAHMPAICIDQPKSIKKALVKVLCD